MSEGTCWEACFTEPTLYSVSAPTQLFPNVSPRINKDPPNPNLIYNDHLLPFLSTVFYTMD